MFFARKKSKIGRKPQKTIKNHEKTIRSHQKSIKNLKNRTKIDQKAPFSITFRSFFARF